MKYLQNSAHQISNSQSTDQRPACRPCQFRRVDPLIKDLVSCSLRKTASIEGVGADAVPTATLEALPAVIETELAPSGRRSQYLLFHDNSYDG
jgi:hypothetical protein